MKDNVIEASKEIIEKFVLTGDEIPTRIELATEEIGNIIMKHLPTSEKVIKCPECGIPTKYACDCAVKSQCE